MTKEFLIAQDAFGLDLQDFEKITINAMKSAFMPYKRRVALIYDVIKSGYARARGGNAGDEAGEG